ncbi:ABC transporter ATP-binding protein [soil metagenome]
MTGEGAVVVRGLGHRFDTRTGPIVVLDGLDLDLEAGSEVALTGPSGAGKSTLLGLLGGLEPPQEGTVTVYGRDLAGLRGNGLAAYRRETVGFVFQHFGLLDTLTAAENLELAATLARQPRSDRRRRALDLLDAVGLGHRATHRPAELSGGERQRVAIARALVNRPRLLLSDEPTGNLDDDSGAVVLELLRSLPPEHGCTLVIFTHDRSVAAQSSRTLALAYGRLHEAART